MQIQKGFQCKSCHSFLSHPIDACPVCGDQFYWLVHVDGPLDISQRNAYVGTMINLMEGTVTEAFLTHGDQLWLPYQFWTSSPTGEALAEFPWIKDLELFQHVGHGAEEQLDGPEPEAAEDPNPWDTVPKMAIPDFTDIEEPEPVAAPEEVKPEARARTKPKRSKPPRPKQKPPKAKAATAGARGKGGARSMVREFFVPMMIFLFFLFLSLSYLVLRYHKNHMVPKMSGHLMMEVSHERPLLS